MSLKEIIKLVIGWRLITIAIALAVIPFITLRSDFTMLDNSWNWFHPLNMWANFDGIHYFDLATYGYGVPRHTDNTFAFFPVYPFLARAFEFYGTYLTSGLLVSHVAFVFALYFLYKLLKLDYKSSTIRLTFMILLFFPTSFFFGSFYTESVFLLLSVLVFYFARQGRFLPAALCALIAGATRITGIFLWPALAIEFYLFYGKEIRKLIRPEALWLLLPPLGLIAFMKYQYLKTNNWLYFVTSQPSFGANRNVDKIILIHQVFFRYAKMMVFVDHFTTLFFTVFLELLTATGFLALIIYGLNKLRLSYLVYVILSFFLPTFTGTFSSMPRYVLVLFPLFALFATILEKAPKPILKAYFFISILLAAITISLFTRGYFIG